MIHPKNANQFICTCFIPVHKVVFDCRRTDVCLGVMGLCWLVGSEGEEAARFPFHQQRHREWGGWDRAGVRIPGEAAAADGGAWWELATATGQS